MPFIAQGKTNWKFLAIVIILAALVSGGLIWFVSKQQNQFAQLSEINENEVVVENKNYGVLSLLGGKPLTDPELANLEVYHSSKFGFSIKIPKEISGMNSCINPESTETKFSVPVKVFEDVEKSIVFIAPEYYYDAERHWDSQNGTTQVSPCNKITYSLDLLRKSIEPIPDYFAASKPSFGWAIRIENIKNDADLDKFIKDNYGSGCLAGERLPWAQQQNVYEIKITEENWDRTKSDFNPECYVNYVAAILYMPEKGKIMSVNFGQEPTFYTDPTNSVMYDAEMLKSFRFE